MPRFSSALATLFTRSENFVFCLCIVDSTVAVAGRLPYRRTRDRRLLHLSRLPAAAAGTRSDTRKRRAVRALRPGSAGRARVLRRPQPGARRALRRGGRGIAGAALKWGLERAGGYGGDFATVLASLRRANRADVVLSTVDTVGIPLMLLARAGRLRAPLVYVAIGLPERLAQLRSERMERLYASALGVLRFRDRVQRVRGERASKLARSARIRHASRVRALRGRRGVLQAGAGAGGIRRRLGRRRPASRLRAPAARSQRACPP